MGHTIGQAGTREEQRVFMVATLDEDATVLVSGYHRKQEWRPTRVAATFERDRPNTTGPWNSWTMMSAHVSGFNLRKDGSAGADHRERLYSNDRGGPDVAAALADMARLVEAHGVDQPEA